MTRSRDLADGKHLTNVDSNTLVVDAANNRVGVGTASPSATLEIDRASANFIRFADSGSLSGLIGLDDGATLVSGGTDGDMVIRAETSGKGVVFAGNGATRFGMIDADGLKFNTDTAAANALDDYEEGVHTASVTCGTSGTITLTGVGDDLSYTKIGNVVNVRGMLQIDSVSSPVGNIKIDLPFTNSSGSGFSSRTPFEVFILNSSSNVRDFVGIIFEGDNKLVIYLGDAGSIQSDASQSLSGDEEIYVNATYKVA